MGTITSSKSRRRARRPLFKRSSARRWRWAVLIGLVAVAGWVQGTSVSGAEDIKQIPGIGHARGIQSTGYFRVCTRASQRDCVIDGETVRIRGHKIRLEDIVAPHTSDAQCAAERKLGQKAMLRLVQLMNYGGYEVVDDGGRDEDSSGRKLRMIVRAGRSVGDKLIDEGLARPWRAERAQSWCK